MEIKLLFFPISLAFLGCFHSSQNGEDSGYEKSGYVSDKEPANGFKPGEAFEVKPRNVLLTGNKDHRLSPVYKVNLDEKSGKPYTGSNQFYREYAWYDEEEKPRWNNHHLPGFEIVSGFNMVNVSHYNVKTGTEHPLFEAPVLIKNLYFPTFKSDTLNGEPVLRKNYFVSVYDQDTNGDGFLTSKDLRRFYFFDLEGKNKVALVPENYSVTNSEYDPANDRMYLFASEDKNKNGQFDYEDPNTIFWIDLKDPGNRGVQYRGEK